MMIELEKEFPHKHYCVVFYKNREKEESDGTLLFDTSDSSDLKRCQTKVVISKSSIWVKMRQKMGSLWNLDIHNS